MNFSERMLALILLLVAAPVFLLLAIAIKLESRGPVLYLQTRVGRFGEPFKIVKFRTMVVNPGKQLTLGESDPRITKVGRFIRKMHLDEVVQAVNVLKGDMSFVGPRPELPRFLEYYPRAWGKVLSVRPGITGLAAVKCADYEYALLASAQDPEMAYINKVLPKKLRYNLFYVRKHSFGLDCLIVWWTIKRFVHMSGAVLKKVDAGR